MPRPLLLTYAPRALESFRKAGLDVVPCSADFRAQYPLVNSVFLPDAGALVITTKRHQNSGLGLVVYRLRESDTGVKGTDDLGVATTAK